MASATKSKSKKAKAKAPSVMVTVSKFDLTGGSEVYRPHTSGPIESFLPLHGGAYRPRGSTPLRDATAQFIAHLDSLREPGTVNIGLLLDESGSMGGNEQSVIAGVNEFVGGMTDVTDVDPDTDGKVLAVIFTDGYENASREVDAPTLAKLISDKEAEGWTFIYLGANQDAWDVGARTGFSGGASGQTVSYASTPQGTSSAMAAVTQDSQSYLADNAGYSALRANSAKRSITEDGEEVLSNTGAQVPAPGDVAAAAGVKPYASVEEALKAAKGATKR